MTCRPAIITGAAGGIARAIALRLVDFQCQNLTLVDLNAEGLAETKDLILAKYPSSNIKLIALDLTETDAAEKVVQATVKEFGALRCLVNCAGTPGGFKTSQETTLELFDKVQQINVRATWLLQKAAVRQMLTQEPVKGE